MSRTDVDFLAAKTTLREVLQELESIENVELPESRKRNALLADMRRRMQYAAHLIEHARIEVMDEYFAFKATDDVIRELTGVTEET